MMKLLLYQVLILFHLSNAQLRATTSKNQNLNHQQADGKHREVTQTQQKLENDIGNNGNEPSLYQQQRQSMLTASKAKQMKGNLFADTTSPVKVQQLSNSQNQVAQKQYTSKKQQQQQVPDPMNQIAQAAVPTQNFQQQAHRQMELTLYHQHKMGHATHGSTNGMQQQQQLQAAPFQQYQYPQLQQQIQPQVNLQMQQNLQYQQNLMHQHQLQLIQFQQEQLQRTQSRATQQYQQDSQEQQHQAHRQFVDQSMFSGKKFPQDPLLYQRRVDQIKQIVRAEHLAGLFDEQTNESQQSNRLDQEVNPLMVQRETIPIERALDDTNSGNATVTGAPSTQSPTTGAPTTQAPTTQAPTTQAPTTQAPTTQAPTTQAPTTQAPTTQAPSKPPTPSPTTSVPTTSPPVSQAPTSSPSDGPSLNPTKPAKSPSGANLYNNPDPDRGPWEECVGWEGQDCRAYILSVTSDNPKIAVVKAGKGNFDIHRVKVYTSVDGLVIRRPERG